MADRRYVLVAITLLVVAGCSGGGSATTTSTTTTHATNNTAGEHTTTSAGHTDTTVGFSGEVGWGMFRLDQRHTAAVSGFGNVDPLTGPRERWRWRMSEPSGVMRWFSTFPLGDLDGDGDLEVVVTTADGAPGVSPRVVALDERDGQAVVMWAFVVPNPEGGVDQYGPALADADGDGLPDVVFSSRDGFLRALDGQTGEVIWEYSVGRLTEAGPMVADLDGDGSLEVVQVWSCVLGTECESGALTVFAADPGRTGEVPPLWDVELAWKADSGEPAIADLDPDDGRDLSQIVWGNWGGTLLVVWKDGDREPVVRDLVLASLDDTVPDDIETAAMRTSPLIADFGDGLTAVFGWMPDYKNYRDARMSAVSIRVSTAQETVDFVPRWTVTEDAWKSSPALLELGDRTLVVTGAGYALGPSAERACDDVAGRYVARDAVTGEVAWTIEMPAGQGDLRGSVTVADIDGDGEPEVIAGVGCGGRLLGIDGATGRIEWERQLGDRLYVSPSIADLDGDGFLEIVIGSLDGNVYALQGG